MNIYTFSHLKRPLRYGYRRSRLLKADLSGEGDADLWLRTKSATGALEMRNGVNLQ